MNNLIGASKFNSWIKDLLLKGGKEKLRRNYNLFLDVTGRMFLEGSNADFGDRVIEAVVLRCH